MKEEKILDLESVMKEIKDLQRQIDDPKYREEVQNK